MLLAAVVRHEGRMPPTRGGWAAIALCGLVFYTTHVCFVGME